MCIKMKIIRYNKIERILGSHLILYNGRVHTTKENVKIKRRLVTLKDKGLFEDDYAELRQEAYIL